MKIVDRYVFAVTRNLPQNQKQDVEKKVRKIIEEKMSQYDGAYSDEQKAEKVLLELGNPDELAQKYTDYRKHLIGPENYHNYVLVLKIVLGSIFLAVTIGFMLRLIFNFGHDNLINSIINYIQSIVSGALQGFAWVTGVFFLLDYKGVNTNKKNGKGRAWKVSDLPEIPHDKALISRSESIVSIIFSTIFIMILYFAPQYLGIYILDKNYGYNIIPFFNIEILNGYNILLFAVFLTTLIKEVLKLIAGRWSIRLSLSVAVLNIVGLVIILTVFRNSGIFNSSLPTALLSSKAPSFDIELGWNMFRRWFVVCFAFGYIVDTVVVLYKGFRYSN